MYIVHVIIQQAIILSLKFGNFTSFKIFFENLWILINNISLLVVYVNCYCVLSGDYLGYYKEPQNLYNTNDFTCKVLWPWSLHWLVIYIISVYKFGTIKY